MENFRRWLSGAKITAGSFVVGVIVLAIASIAGQPASEASGGSTPTSSASATATPSATPTATPTAGCTTWATALSDYTNNRWFAAGIAEIKNATTNEEATAAAHAWLAEVRKDPNLLAGAAKYFLGRDVDKATLSTDGCATDAAVQLVTELELTMDQAKAIVPDTAPATGYNSGVDNGTVVGSSTTGISGDRKAIKITLPDGRVVWIMARCGNIVTIGLPPVPAGPTDQPRITLAPKIASQDVGANPAVAPFKKDATGGNASNGETLTH
jgi:hypothetical protein